MRDYLDDIYEVKTFEKPNDFSELIEVVLEELGVKYENRGKYYLLQNPLTDQDNKMSAQWWIDEGNFKSYNCAVEVVRGDKKVTDTSLSLTEFIRLSGQYDLYIDFILSSNYIKKSDLFLYKEALIEYSFFKKWSRTIDNFRKTFFSVYITDKDVLSYQTDREVRKFTKFYKEKTEEDEEKKRAIELYPVNEFFNIKCSNYLKKRKLAHTDTIYPIMVKTKSSEHGMPAICIEYPNKFKKIRLLEGNLRYMVDAYDGKYSMLYPARHIGSDKCYIIEGEFESQVFANYVKEDVFALHNTSSVPKCKQIESYHEVIIKLDYDRFEENSAHVMEKIKEIAPLAKVTIEPKVKLLTENGKKMYDYNDLHIIGKLREFLSDEEGQTEVLKKMLTK